jgi:hypothetical protein
LLEEEQGDGYADHSCGQHGVGTAANGHENLADRNSLWQPVARARALI